MTATAEATAAAQAKVVIEAEEAVIGSMIIDPRVVDVVAGIISPGDFSDPTKLGRVFALMLDMHDARQPVGDIVMLRARLVAAGLMDAVGGNAGLGRLSQVVPNASHAVYYAQQIRRAAALRRITSLGRKMIRQAEMADADPEQIIKAIEAEATRATGQERETGTVTLAEAAREALRRMDDAASVSTSRGRPTGFYSLDQQIGGLFPGELVIAAARPSMGKTVFGTQIALHNARKKRPALLVTLEMEATDIALRYLAAELDVEVRALRSRPIDSESRAEADRCVDSIADMPFHLWEARKATVARIRGIARLMQSTVGLELLVVDYLGLISATDRRKPRWEQVSEISGDLKSLALELRVPVLALCQVGREAEGSAPTLNQLRDSGSIEQDADVVMMLHRESRAATVGTLDVAKNRNGSTGAVTLRFDPSRTQFSDAEF